MNKKRVHAIRCWIAVLATLPLIIGCQSVNEAPRFVTIERSTVSQPVHSSQKKQLPHIAAQEVFNRSDSTVNEVDSSTLNEWLDNDLVHLFAVQLNKDDYERFPPATFISEAKELSMQQLPENKKRICVFLGAHAKKTAVVDAYRIARGMGYSNCKVLAGGIETWVAAENK